ncbi:hypothetical protein Q2T42_12230 [Leptolyngbya boryana CZ1]|uniref:Uncharacterized protein n=1 Tax=Leptolyngbya boryana CZ1 TaxID=3060204 RepID=A0AA97AYP4_LEPBY|nr:hypothetical protein [Leptolyngbya boryana]WNZ48596.1 hypothetical protein Q2T42_12230 [Leptolyngbya boryana CZ1]
MELGSVTSNPRNYQSSAARKLPTSLQRLLSQVNQQRYEELYEENTTGTSLKDALQEILDGFRSLDQLRCHPRWIWMAVLLSLTAKPTVEAYLPNDNRPRIAIALMLMQLEDCHDATLIPKAIQEKIILPLREQIADSKISNDLTGSVHKHLCPSKLVDVLFPRLSEGCQALDESLDVLKNGLKALNQSDAQLALLSILEDCFEGYAIFPGTSERHKLLTWWLYEIVPAVWDFHLPQSFMTIRGVQTVETILESFIWEPSDTLFLLDLLH